MERVSTLGMRASRYKAKKMIYSFTKKPESKSVEDIDTDTSYLNEPDAFEVNTHVHSWPADHNPFLDRMAKQLKPGFGGVLCIQDFLSLVSAATKSDDKSVFTFRVTVDGAVKEKLSIKFEVVSVANTTMVPLTADNAGFFIYAMNWMAEHRPSFDLSVCGAEFFWVHVP